MRRQRARIVAAVEIADRAQRGLVVRDRTAAPLSVSTPVAAFAAAADAVLVGEAEQILAGGEIGRDRHGRAGEVEVVEIGDRQRRIDRGGGLVLGIGQRAAGGRDDRRIVDRGDGDRSCWRALLFSAPSSTTNETVRASVLGSSLLLK